MSVSTAELGALWGQAGLGQSPGLAQTIDRRYINNEYTPASGVMQMSGIWLPAEMIIRSVVMITGSGLPLLNTHAWVALYNNELELLAQSVDDTATGSFGMNTKVTKTLIPAQKLFYTGPYYIGWVQTATTLNSLLAAVAFSNSIAGNDPPVISGTSTTGLTSTAPANAAPLVGQINTFYAYVS